jgi:hypothetical protein
MLPHRLVTVGGDFTAKKMRPDQPQFATELVRDGESISALAWIFAVHPTTIHRVLEG